MTKLTKDQLQLQVTIGSLTLKHPVMPASGTFGEEMAEVMDLNQLAAIVPKSITKHPRSGNAAPRVCEVAGGMLNAIGIQSKGIEHYLTHTLPFYRKYDVPVISSISAESIEEYAEMAEILSAEDLVKALELNISCPNLQNNGLAFGMDAETTYELVKAVRQVTELPLIVKLTPNVTSIQKIALAAERGGADGLNIGNTLLAMAIDVHTRRPKLGNVMGGMSGPAVKPVIVRMIYQAAQVTKLPIIGCGGIMTGEDAIEMMLAGASAVQVGTASFIRPTAMIEILDGICDYMLRYGIREIRELVGKVEV